MLVILLAQILGLYFWLVIFLQNRKDRETKDM